MVFDFLIPDTSEKIEADGVSIEIYNFQQSSFEDGELSGIDLTFED